MFEAERLHMKNYNNPLAGFDLDGVLRKDKYSPIDESRKQFLMKLKSDYGFDIAILSGWSLMSLEKVSSDNDISNCLSFLVGENGGAMLDMKNPEKIIYYGNKNEIQMIRSLIENDEFIGPQISSEDIGKYSIYSINFDNKSADLEQIKQISENLMSKNKLDYNVYRGSHGIDIVPRGIDKGYAIDCIRNLRGYDYVITAGDGENDIPMLDKSDIAFFIDSGDRTSQLNSRENIKIIDDVEQILDYLI